MKRRRQAAGREDSGRGGNRQCSSTAVAHAKGVNLKSFPLTAEELARYAPCGIVENVLPSELADNLLRVMVDDCKEWVKGTWWMFGKEHVAPRSSAFFEFKHLGEEGVLPDAEISSREVSAKVTTRKTPIELQQAAAVINKWVNDLKSKRVPEEPRDAWECSYALANWYKDGQDCVGSHSDRMTLLGPRPVIASLSLGATRTFRLKKAKGGRVPHSGEGSKTLQKEKTQNDRTKAEGMENILRSDGRRCEEDYPTEEVKRQEDVQLVAPSQKASQGVGRDFCVASIDIPLRHNTLIIMWPPCQEEWRHEVPRCSDTKLEQNAISGSGRLNLTFRMLKPEWAERVPMCRCGKGAIMKARVGAESNGKRQYYYSCDTTQGQPPCGYFEWVHMDGEEPK